MQLQVDQSVWVEILGDTGRGNGVSCVVSDVSPAGVALRLPGLQSLPRGLSADCEVRLRVTDANGVHTTIARVRRTVTTPIALVLLAPPQKFATKQNRKFFRVGAKLAVSCTILESWDKAAVGKTDPRAKTLDISAGGMRLATILSLCVGDELTLELNVQTSKPQPTQWKLKGQVTWIGLNEGDARNRTLAGVTFQVTKREQDALVLLMYELQRKRLR